MCQSRAGPRALCWSLHRPRPAASRGSFRCGPPSRDRRPVTAPSASAEERTKHKQREPLAARWMDEAARGPGPEPRLRGSLKSRLLSEWLWAFSIHAPSVELTTLRAKPRSQYSTQQVATWGSQDRAGEACTVQGVARQATPQHAAHTRCF